MSWTQKIFAAGAIILCGLAIAMLFRRSGEPGEVAKRGDEIAPAETSSSYPIEQQPVDESARSAHVVLGQVEPLGSDVEPRPATQSRTFGRNQNSASPAPAPADPAPSPTATQPQNASYRRKPTRVHVVRDGDTLSYIAERYLGRGDRYQDIFDYNRDLLSNPDILPIGARLKIPPDDYVSPRAADDAPNDSLVPVRQPNPWQGR